MTTTMQLPKLYMAPMKGFTDHLFRNTFAEYFNGFDLAVAPFIASKRDNKIKKKYVKDVLPENNSRLPVVPQILSNTAGDFTVLANFLYDLGYPTVNWNLGCPFPAVADKKRGSGMLPHTDMIHNFLDDVMAGIKGALSIKIRLGWRSCDDIFRLIPLLNQYPLAELIIHPRTGIQRYDGEVDFEAFERCLSMVKHPVVYNGDIRTSAIFNTLSQRFDGVHRWMIGRWCLANPFLPHIIKTGQDDIGDKLQLMKQFHQALFEAYCRVLQGPAQVLNKMKGLWRYFALPFKDCNNSLQKIKKTTRPTQYLEQVNLFFETDARLK
jgi:tRNA-dihydrouridine synthase